MISDVATHALQALNVVLLSGSFIGHGFILVIDLASTCNASYLLTNLLDAGNVIFKSCRRADTPYLTCRLLVRKYGLEAAAHFSVKFRFREKGSRPNENEHFAEEKFKELDSDQIEGGEFKF